MPPEHSRGQEGAAAADTDIPVASIVVPAARMRRLRDDVVDSLAESISERGLLQPIVVRPRGANSHWLVAGRHRFEAARKLGHDRIQAVVLDDGLDADAALSAVADAVAPEKETPAVR